METDCIHYTPEGFLADGWLGPREGSGGGWPFAEVQAAHRADELVKLRDGIWVFIRAEHLFFTAWMFEVDGFISGDPDNPSDAFPLLELIGRTFDGLREMHGAPCMNPIVSELAAALIAFDELLTARGWEMP